jgi:hypothetical protein
MDTPQQARARLAESAGRCAEMLAETLGGCGGRGAKFPRDGWAPPWPVGLEMVCYMLSHENPSSRAGMHGRLSARIPVAERSDVWDLELGKVERVRVPWRPRIRFLIVQVSRKMQDKVANAVSVRKRPLPDLFARRRRNQFVNSLLNDGAEIVHKAGLDYAKRRHIKILLVQLEHV